MKLFLLLALLSFSHANAQTVYWAQDDATSSPSTAREGIFKAGIAAIPTSVSTTMVTSSSLSSPNAFTTNIQSVLTDYTNGYIYWLENNSTNGNKIYRISTGASFPISSSSNVTTVVTGLPNGQVGGMALDIHGTGTIYFTVDSTGNGDGTSPSLGDKVRKGSLASLPITSSTATTIVGGGDQFRGIAIDFSASPDKLYVVDGGSATYTTRGKRIHRFNTTGTDQVVTTSTIFVNGTAGGSAASGDSPYEVDLDQTNHYLYWTEQTTAKNIYRVSTSASAPVAGAATTPCTNVSWASEALRSLAVDQTNSRVYIGNNTGTTGSTLGQGKIQRFSISSIPVSSLSNVVTGIESVKGIGLGFGNTLLPVDLIYFIPQKQGRGALLKWATASETDNSHFEMERSLNGHEWENIGQVEGHGTTSNMQEYTFFDPLLPEGQISVFYRMIQVDHNGERNHCPEKVLYMNVEFGYEIMDHPLNDVSQLNVKYGSDAPCDIEIRDMQGNIVVSEHMKLHEGSNYFNLGYAMNQLTHGIYFLSIMTPEGMRSTKIVK